MATTRLTDTRLLVSPKEVIELTGFGRSTVYRAIRAGELPAVRLGRAVRVPTASLEKWIERQTVAGPNG